MMRKKKAAKEKEPLFTGDLTWAQLREAGYDCFGPPPPRSAPSIHVHMCVRTYSMRFHMAACNLVCVSGHACVSACIRSIRFFDLWISMIMFCVSPCACLSLWRCLCAQLHVCADVHACGCVSMHTCAGGAPGMLRPQIAVFGVAALLLASLGVL